MGKSEQHFYSNYIVICRLNDLLPSAEDSLKYTVNECPNRSEGTVMVQGQTHIIGRKSHGSLPQILLPSLII